MIAVSRRWCALLLVLSLSVSCLGGLAAATNSLISIKVEADSLVAGQRFSFAIRLHDNGLATPVGALPDMGGRITVLSGPELTTETGLDESGRQGRFVFMRYQARANSAGYAELPPISVQYGVQSLKTEALLLQIRKDDGSPDIPPDLVWRIHADRVFVGQSVFVTLDLTHCPTIIFPDSIEIPSLFGGSFEEVKGVGRIESDRLAGRDFQRLPLSGFIYTPTKSGTINLPMARVSLGKTVVSTPSTSLAILDLPTGTIDRQAIGDLRLVTSLDHNAIGLSESARLSVRVEGTGNLRTLGLPEPVLLGLNAVSRSENDKVLPTEQGYRGYREAVFELAAPAAGVYTIAIPSFAILGFDGRLSMTEARNITLEVLSAASVQKVSSPVNPVELMSLAEAAVLDDSGIRPAWAEWFDAGMAAYKADDYQTAQSQFLKAWKMAPAQAGLLYNLGVVCQAKGSQAQAIYYLQKALRQAPYDARVRQALLDFERQLGLEHQLVILAMPPRLWLMIGLGASLVLMLAFGVPFIFRRNLILLSAVALTILIAACLGGIWIAAEIQRSTHIGVVSETGTMMKRIPETQARDWLHLPSGTTVQLLAEYQGYQLVETAFGSKGWVDHSSLYVDQDQALR